MPRPPRGRIHQIIQSRRTPRAKNLGSQAVCVAMPGETLYVGQILPLQVPSGRAFTGDLAKQLSLCLGNLLNIVKDANFTMDHLVRLQLYYTQSDAVACFNEQALKFFVGGSFPAITYTMVAGLPEEVAVAIDAVAIKPNEEDLY